MMVRMLWPYHTRRSLAISSDSPPCIRWSSVAEAACDANSTRSNEAVSRSYMKRL